MSGMIPFQFVYVMPSTSGRTATYPRKADKLKFFYELKDLRDKLRLENGLKPAIEMYKEIQAVDSRHI